jgi:hypothetical protein
MASGAFTVRDRVGQQHRRCRVGPHLRDADQGTVVALDPHQKIGEREICQQLPLPDYRMQMVDGRAGQHGVLGQEVTESRHESWLRRGAA